MRWWVDADGVARLARELVARRARRLGVKCIWVSSRPLPKGEAEVQRVEPGDQATDHHILQHALSGDLVITRDLELAAECLQRGLHAMNDRGTLWSEDSLRERASLARFHRYLHETGETTRGTKGYGPSDAKAFADGLERWIQKNFRVPPPDAGPPQDTRPGETDPGPPEADSAESGQR